MSTLLARLRAVFEGLSANERRLLSLSGVLAAVLLLWLGVVQPLASARDRAAARWATAESQLVLAVRLRAEFDEVNARLSSVERRITQGPQGNIFTLLESLATRAAVKVESMEPQTPLASDRYRETKVEVVLKGVTLGQAVNYLHLIESAPQLMSVKSLRMRTRRDNSALMDVSFTVSTFEPTS
jgi:type II secretory pathway component PulM